MKYRIKQSNLIKIRLQDKLQKLKDEERRISMKNGPKKFAKNNKIHKEKKQIERKINLLQGRVEQF